MSRARCRSGRNCLLRCGLDGSSVLSRSPPADCDLLDDSVVDEPKRFVYVLKNFEPEPRYYVGLTAHVAGRLTWHNAGRCPHTAKYRPWQLHVSIEFNDEPHAS